MGQQQAYTVPATSPGKFLLRRWLGALGAAAIARWRGAARAVALACAVLVYLFKPSTWRRSVRAEFSRQCLRSGVAGLPSTLTVAALVGLVMVFQALYWLQLFGQTDAIGQFLVLVLVREIGPLVTGLILVGRSGMVSLVELWQLSAGGQLKALDAQGVDPFIYLLLPRVAAFALSLFALTVFFLATALGAGYVAGSAFGVVNLPLGGFIDAVLRAMTINEYALVVLKPLTAGFLVGVVIGVTALAQDASAWRQRQLHGLLPKAFMRSILAVLLASGLLTLLL